MIKTKVKKKCSDCGRALFMKDQGSKWEICQVCGAIICINCMYYNRFRREGLYSYHYDVLRVCKNHRI